ncbi:MAG: hypothetical protein AB7L09_22025 [Nitrospira sp.]
MITADTTETTAEADAPATPRVTAHADCDHPKTKAARAACRRARKAEWIDVTDRETVAKGDTIRVHTAEDMVEGVLLGWGAQRLIVRADDERVTFKIADVLRVQAANV